MRKWVHCRERRGGGDNGVGIREKEKMKDAESE